MDNETDLESQKNIAGSNEGTEPTPNFLEAPTDRESHPSELLESSQLDPQLSPEIQTKTEQPVFATDTAVPKDPSDESPSRETINQTVANKSFEFTPTSPNALTKSSKLAGLVAAILLGGGTIAALTLLERSPQNISPVGAQIVPQDTLATLTVTTDETAWTTLRQFGTDDSQKQFDQLLTDWKDQLFTLNGYSFKRDIKPWIGDRVTLAFLPTDQPQGEGLAAAVQNIILIAPITDSDKAKSLLESNSQRLAITTDTTEGDRSYRKIPIKTIKTAAGQTIEAAVIGANWLLLGNTASGIEQAIDTYRGERSLQDNASYRSATADLENSQSLGKKFAQLYLNIPMATEVLKAPAGISTSQPRSLVPLQESQGIVATALIESEGLRFLGTSWLLPKNDLAYADLNNEAGDMLRRLPDDTLLALSGSNLQQTWRAISEGNISTPFFPNPQNLQAGLLSQTGLDIEEDIMPWVSGEFAFGLLSPTDEPTGNESEKNKANQSEPDNSEPDNSEVVASSLLLMVKTNDRATAESVWTQLDDVIVDRYRYQTKTTDLPGGSVTQWISPFQGVQFSHGWLPGNVAFFTVGSDVAKTLLPAPGSSLVGTNLFQTLTNNAPTPNHGQFFLDLAKINNTKGVFPLPQLSQELSASESTSAIQAIGLTSTVGDRTMDYDLYIKLSKAARPGPI